jgi:hypothetical protein
MEIEQANKERRKKGIYEELTLGTIAKLGITTPYSVCKEIVSSRTSRDIINSYPTILRAIQRLTANQFLLALPGKDSKGREVKRFGLTFKGFLKLSPAWEEAKEIIERHRETITNAKLLLTTPLIFIEKGRRKKLQRIRDKEMNFILQCLLFSEENEYEQLMKILEDCNLNRENEEIVGECFYKLLEKLPFFPEILSKIKKSNEKLVVEVLKDCIDLLAIELMTYYDNEIKVKALSIKELIEKLGLKEKSAWLNALQFLTELVPATTAVKSKNYGNIPKLIIGIQKNGKIKWIEKI